MAMAAEAQRALTRICHWLAVMAVLAAAPVAASDGEKLFGQCKACHDVGEGARNKVGPHLDDIIGRTAGTVTGFNYSTAMRKAGEGGLQWNAVNLAQYLQRPRDFVPGNRMSYRGMADAADRAALIAWLEQKSAAIPNEDAAATAAPAGLADTVIAMKGDAAYGEYLSGECVTCHQLSGHADGIPSIVGVPRDYFIRSLFEYKSNVRNNDVMKLRVINLGNEEIAALAEYFSKLKPN
jgi:cytochrome c